jgi:hypothetical protein
MILGHQWDERENSGPCSCFEKAGPVPLSSFPLLITPPRILFPGTESKELRPFPKSGTQILRYVDRAGYSQIDYNST